MWPSGNLSNSPTASQMTNSGKAKFNKQDYQGALADYTQAITLDPHYAEAYTNRGFARNAQGDKTRAIEDLRKAADLYQQQGKTSDYQRALDRIKEFQR